MGYISLSKNASLGSGTCFFVFLFFFFPLHFFPFFSSSLCLHKRVYAYNRRSRVPLNYRTLQLMLPPRGEPSVECPRLFLSRYLNKKKKRKKKRYVAGHP